MKFYTFSFIGPGDYHFRITSVSSSNLCQKVGSTWILRLLIKWSVPVSPNAFCQQIYVYAQLS